MQIRSKLDQIPACGLALCLFGALAYCGHIFAGLGGSASNGFFDDGIYNAVMIGSALTLLLRGLSNRADRSALVLIGSGMLLWAIGDLYYTIAYSGATNVPSPSVADAFYLSFYPLLYVGIGRLIMTRWRGLPASMWLDGLIAGLGMCAVAAGLILGPILSATGGSFAVVATNLAYPIGDLLLFVMVVTAIGLTGWRPGWMWGLLALGLTIQVAADSVYLYQVATNTYSENTWLETMWPLASVIMLSALWLPAEAPRRTIEHGWRTLAVPGVGALCAVGLLFADHGAVSINDPARFLALATIVVIVARVILAFRDSLRREEESRVQALTDALTGLGNRRQLTADLDAALAQATPASPWLLVLFDLNGFKHYNDSFGHPAGDALLARVGRNLQATAAPYGRAYRMGGDEFCALLAPGETPTEVLAQATSLALSESGDGFEISAAHGLAVLPVEASEASSALQLADRRLYSRKEGRPSGVKHQLRGVLLQVLSARTPALVEHLDGVAALALAVGRRMDLGSEAIDELVRAAEMHDIGKTAVPETIINKPGPLDEDEWRFMHQHTIFGERILSAAPALVPVAKLVRSSHERWDGGGYPDRLRGEEIPLGSRIICAADAFDAIIAERPYKAARSETEALAELARCAGSQFDPEVVRVLTEVVRERQSASSRTLEQIETRAAVPASSVA